MASRRHLLPPFAISQRRLRQRVKSATAVAFVACFAVAAVGVAAAFSLQSSKLSPALRAKETKGSGWEPRDVRRLAKGKYDKSKLESEASSVGDVFKGIQNFFNPPPPPPTKAQIEEVERTEARIVQNEEVLSKLRVSVPAGDDENGQPKRRAAPIGVLQSKGKQAMAIFAATTEEVLRDLLLSVRIAANDFTDRNVLVVPVLIDTKARSLGVMSEQLAGAKLMQQAQVALPEPKNDEDKAAWGALLAAEFEEAEAQGKGAEAASGGLAVLVLRSGKIVRRGVGRPQWEAVFKELDV